jgi:chorismate synthase
MKPLSSLRKPLRSVDIRSAKPVSAAKIRSDVCAVPAAGVIAETMIALTLVEDALDKFGGDSLEETLTNYRAHVKRVEGILRKKNSELRTQNSE